MKAIKYMICFLFVVAIGSLLVNMRIEAILVGVIAITNLILYLVYNIFIFKKNISTTKKLQSRLYQFFIQMKDLETLNSIAIGKYNFSQYFVSFTIVSALVSIMFLGIKIIYYGFDYIVFSFFQAITLFIALMPFDITLLIIFKLLINSKYYKRNDIYEIIKCSQLTNLGLIIIVLSSLIMGWPLFSTVQILLFKMIVNFVSILTIILKISKYSYIEGNNYELKHSEYKDINFSSAIITGIIMAFFTIIVYKLGLGTGSIPTAITMAVYTLLFSNLFVSIGNWIEKYNEIKKIFPSLITIVLSLIFQILIVNIPMFYELFNIVQLSQKNWNQITVICFLMVVCSVLIKLIETLKWNNDRHKNAT